MGVFHSSFDEIIGEQRNDKSLSAITSIIDKQINHKYEYLQ